MIDPQVRPSQTRPDAAATAGGDGTRPNLLLPGCSVPATRCEIHHIDEWLRDKGFTDVDALIATCDAHHDHIHLEKLIVQRERDGTVTVRERATGIIIAITIPKRAAAA